MKKKIFAAFCAALTACSVLCAPASAESAYKKGDVNMDGMVDVTDAQLILQEYVSAAVVALPVSFTEEQLELATISGNGVKGLPFSGDDAQIVLMYYVNKITGKDIPDNVMEYYETVFKPAREKEMQNAKN